MKEKRICSCPVRAKINLTLCSVVTCISIYFFPPPVHPVRLVWLLPIIIQELLSILYVPQGVEAYLPFAPNLHWYVRLDVYLTGEAMVYQPPETVYSSGGIKAHDLPCGYLRLDNKASFFILTVFSFSCFSLAHRVHDALTLADILVFKDPPHHRPSFHIRGDHQVFGIIAGKASNDCFLNGNGSGGIRVKDETEGGSQDNSVSTYFDLFGTLTSLVEGGTSPI